MKDFKQISLVLTLGVALGLVGSYAKDAIHVPNFGGVTQRQLADLNVKADEIDRHAEKALGRIETIVRDTEAILERVKTFQDCQCRPRRGVPGAAE